MEMAAKMRIFTAYVEWDEATELYIGDEADLPRFVGLQQVELQA